MKKAKYMIYLTCLLAVFVSPFGKIEAADNKTAEVKVEQKAVTKLSPILIYDEDKLLEITIEDAGKYHGDICVCLVIAFRATKLAISQLWKGEIPRRGDFKIVSVLPTSGSQDAFEFITRIITRKKGEDFKLKIPKETDIKNMSKDNFTFTFIRKSSNEQIKIQVKGEVFPEGYFELRKKVKFNIPTPATPEGKRTFKQAKQKLKDSLLYFWSADKIFDFEIVSPH
jgi:formylmethanofuran dehydrogenase subunit E